MKVCRGLCLYSVLSGVFMCIHAWSEAKSCGAWHMDLVTMYGLANNISVEVG